MPGADGGRAVLDQGLAAGRVLTEGSDVLAHSGTGLRHQKIFARRKQALAIVPRSRDQRNTAGQRLEHTDGGNTREQCCVVAGEMQRESMPGKDVQPPGVGQPAAVMGTVLGQQSAGFVWVADAV